MSNFLSDKAEEVNDHFGQADEVLAAQHFVLRRNTGRAVIQVTDAQILAAKRHHRPGSKTETLRAQHGRLDDIETRLQTAISLQAHLVSHVLRPQYLVRFRQAEFPGTAGIFDGAQRTCARCRRRSPRS